MTTSLALGTKVTAISSTGHSVKGTISAIIPLPSGLFDYNVDYDFVGFRRTLRSVPEFLVSVGGRHVAPRNDRNDQFDREFADINKDHAGRHAKPFDDDIIYLNGIYPNQYAY